MNSPAVKWVHSDQTETQTLNLDGWNIIQKQKTPQDEQYIFEKDNIRIAVKTANLTEESLAALELAWTTQQNMKNYNEKEQQEYDTLQENIAIPL